LFEAFCAKSHRAIRLYGALDRDLPDGSEIEDEPWKLKRGVETLTRENERLERTLARYKRKREAVQLELETLKEERSRTREELREKERVNKELLVKFHEIEGEDALIRAERLKMENSFLAGEVKRLTEELASKREEKEIRDLEPVKFIEEATDDSMGLEGVKVAIIGGVEGLMPHYR